MIFKVVEREFSAGKAAMNDKNRKGGAVPWLEAILVTTVVVFLVQLCPMLGVSVGRLADVRNWSRGTWLWLNIGLVFALAAMRFGPQVIERLRCPQRRFQPLEHEKSRLSEKEERALYERMQEARKRQVV